MQWELEWVSANVHRYTSPEHAVAVQRNIQKRYQILALQRRIEALEREQQRKTVSQ